MPLPAHAPHRPCSPSHALRLPAHSPSPQVYIEYSTETDVRRALGSQGQMDIFKFSQYPVLSLSLLSTRTTQFKVGP